MEKLLARRFSRLAVVLSISALIALPIVGTIPLLKSAEATTTVIAAGEEQHLFDATTMTVAAGDTLIIDGRLTSEGFIVNYGNIIVRGELDTTLDYSRVDNHGIILIIASGVFDACCGSTAHSGGQIVNHPTGIIRVDIGADFNTSRFTNSGSFTDFNAPAPSDPVIHMQDTTATVGSVTFAGRQINAEFVTPTSQLIGDKIDSITLKLQKLGNPPGTFQVGVFNANLTPKKSFEIRPTSTLSTTFQDYEFKLPNNELYTIQSGDRIGIKYNGGTTSNAVSVMTDRDFSDPFDGNNSYRARYEANWIVSTGEDMYMILKQTHG